MPVTMPPGGSARQTNGRPATRAGRPSPCHRASGVGLLQLDDVLRRGALLALDDVELDPLAFGQALEALGLDRRMMDEAVLLTVLGGDEAEALGVIEPLDRAGGACHFLLLACCCNRSPAMPPSRLRKRVI